MSKKARGLGGSGARGLGGSGARGGVLIVQASRDVVELLGGLFVRDVDIDRYVATRVRADRPEFDAADCTASAVLDVRLDGGDELESGATVRDTCPSLRIVVRTRIGSAQQGAGAGHQHNRQRMTARDVLPLGELARTGVMGGTAPSMARTVLAEAHRRHLTARERDILGAAVVDDRRTAIASRLGITVGTVRTHIPRLLDKCGAGDLRQLAARLRSLGPTPA